MKSETKVGWKSVSMMPGARCVEMDLIQMKLELSVTHLVDIVSMVSRYYFLHANMCANYKLNCEPSIVSSQNQSL